MKRKMLLFLIIFSVFVVSMITPSYSEDTIPSPKKQIESGVSPEDVMCRENRVLVIRDNGKVACVKESTSEKLRWNIIKIEFTQKETITTHHITMKNNTELTYNTESHLLENQNDATSESDISNIKSIPKTDSQQEREDYLNSLNFGLISDESFKGDLYGFDQNIHLRQPAPMQYFFAPNHYVLNENDLTENQNLNEIIAIPLTSNNINDGTIDYREWLPTWIASGYYLKWVDITQPEDQYHSGSEGKGEIKLTYIPKNLRFSEEITTKEFFDINMYVINVVIADDESTIYMKTSSEIKETTKDGTATDIIYENKWDGYMQYVYAARSDPAKHSVAYDSPKISIASGGSALTMQEHENIVI